MLAFFFFLLVLLWPVLSDSENLNKENEVIRANGVLLRFRAIENMFSRVNKDLRG